MFVLGPRGRVRVAFAVLAVAVGTLSIVAASSSWFDLPESECVSSEVVLAKSVNFNDRHAWLDLPAGVYRSLLIADGEINTTFRTYLDDHLSDDRRPRVRPYTYITSWAPDRDDSLLMGRRVHTVDGETVTVWTGLVRNPGGVARFGVQFMDALVRDFYGDNTQDEWNRSARWRWEIVRPGVCEPPETASQPDLEHTIH